MDLFRSSKTKMKMISRLAITLSLVLAVLAGCAKNQGVDTRPLEKSFAGAEPALQEAANRTVAAVKAADYESAVRELSYLGSSEKLSAQQQKAVATVLQQAQKMLAANPPKTVDQLPMAMPK